MPRLRYRPERAGIGRHALILALAILASVAARPTHAEGPAPLHREFVDGPWGQLHVRVAGRRGDPTLILLHQTIWSSAQFQRAQEELADRAIYSIAIDLPGYGDSAAPLTPPTIAQYTDAIAVVMRHFGFASSHLLGVNEGGTIAAAFAAAHPEQVTTLVLEGPVIMSPLALARYYAAPRAYVPPRPDGSHLQTGWQRATEAAGTKLSVAALDATMQGVYQAGPAGWFAEEAAYRYDLLPVLKQLRSPVMLLTYPGQRFHDASQVASAARPDFTVVHLDFDGSCASYDRPDLWSEAVARYLKSTH